MCIIHRLHIFICQLLQKTKSTSETSTGSNEPSDDEDIEDDSEGKSEPEEEERSKMTISARRRKIIPVEVTRPNTRLYWHYTTDADVYFGVFKHPVSGFRA